MSPEAEKLERWFRDDMRAHPENWMWLWRKVGRHQDGTPVTEDELRQFWGIPPDVECPP